MIITHSNSLMSTICLSPPRHFTPREGCNFMMNQSLLKITLLSEMTISLYHKLWWHERSRNYMVYHISLLIYLKIFRYFQGWAMLRERRLQHISGFSVKYYHILGASWQSLRAAGWPRTTPNTSQDVVTNLQPKFTHTVKPTSCFNSSLSTVKA